MFNDAKLARIGKKASLSPIIPFPSLSKSVLGLYLFLRIYKSGGVSLLFCPVAADAVSREVDALYARTICRNRDDVERACRQGDGGVKATSPLKERLSFGRNIKDFDVTRRRIDFPAGAYALVFRLIHITMASEAARYFPVLHLTPGVSVPGYNLPHLGCAFGDDAQLGKLVGELQGNGSVSVRDCLLGPQQVCQTVSILVIEVHPVGFVGLRVGVPGNNLGRLRAFPVDRLDGFHCTRCSIGYLVYAHLVAALELHVELFATRPVAAHAVRFVFCNARPRLFAARNSEGGNL